MGVNQIEPIITGSLGELNRKRQRVVGVFEELVAIDLHGVEMQAGHIVGQAKGSFVTDEMNFVAARGEFLPQRGCKNAAAPDARVAGNADLQRTLGRHGFQKWRAARVIGPKEAKTRGSLGYSAMAAAQPPRAPFTVARASCRRE